MRDISSLRKLLGKLVWIAKGILPTGTPFDDALNYISAWIRLGYIPHVSSPRTFNEYLQRNKQCFLGDIDLASRVTDKYLFKEWLKEKGFANLIVPTLGLYDSAEEIRSVVFDSYSILKPTHLSGTAIPIYDSRKLDSLEILKINEWTRTDYYRRSREVNYKGLQKRLIYEPLLLDSANNIPMDYKFFMCLGKPLMVQVDIDRHTNHTRQLYSVNWELLDIEYKFSRNLFPLDRPRNLNTALEVASEISTDFPICRVDLYLLPDNIIKAGEITFFPEGGTGNFSPVSADFALGSKMKRILEFA